MFIIDTGAMFTCCIYKAFDKRMRECELENCETKFLGGLVKGSRVKFYKCALKQFTIGSINMGEKIYFCKDIDDYHNNFELLTA